MKHSTYSLSADDISAITAALSILPAFEFIEADNMQSTYTLCASAGSKLFSHEKLTVQETYLIALAVDSAYKALRNELPLDDESKAEIKDFIFIYNKLEPIFSPMLDM